MTNDAANENTVNENADTVNAGAPRVEVWRSEFPVEQAEEFRVTRRGFGAMLCGACVAGAAGIGIVGAAEGESAAGVEGAGVVNGGEDADATPSSRAEGSAKPFRAMLSDELPAGSGHAVRDPSTGLPILVVRTEDGELRAYDQRCTHLLCPVHYEPRTEAGGVRRAASIHCPCHHGFFDPATGAPTAGPPRRALPRFAVGVEDGWIVVGGREPAR